MARAREVFEASEDFTVGLEEEFGIIDPDTRSLAQRFGELQRRRRGGRGAGGVGRRRADRVRDRDPLGQRRELRRRHGAPARGSDPPVRARGRARRAAVGYRHASLEPVAGAAHHRHRALPPRRGGPEVRGLAEQHVQPPRARGHPRGRPGGRRMRPAAADPARSCSRSRPTPRSWTAATRAFTRRAARSSPRAFRAAGSRTRSGASTPTRTTWTSWSRTNSIVEHTQLWWSVRPHHSFGTVEFRICDAQIRAETHRPRWRG